MLPGLAEGSMIEYWVEVEDNNNATGPGIGSSEHQLARVVSEAEKRFSLRAALMNRWGAKGNLLPVCRRESLIAPSKRDIMLTIETDGLRCDDCGAHVIKEMSDYEVQIFFDAACRVVSSSAAESAARGRGTGSDESSPLQRWLYQWRQAQCRAHPGPRRQFLRDDSFRRVGGGWHRVSD